MNKEVLVKDKHLRIHVKLCLALAEASNCPRRKFGAVLINPERNTILMNGYNGGPRGGGDLCGGNHCIRDGLTPDDVVVKFDGEVEPDADEPKFYVEARGDEAIHFSGMSRYQKVQAEAFAQLLLSKYPPIRSGTQVEVGCVHAEMNVICNCAHDGVPTKGAWLLVTGEPCLMCAKLIHHAGIVKVLAVGGGYMGRNGVDYLRMHGVEVVFVSGPQDPRLAKALPEGGDKADELD